MRKKGKLIVSVSLVVLTISVPLLAYFLASSPENINGGTTPTARFIELEEYSGWKGVESMITPLDEYVKKAKGVAISFSDLLWPHADSQNPFQDLVDGGLE